MTTEAITPLRQRMIEDMNARKLCAGTQRGHIRACKQFAAFLKRSPDTATLDDIRRFQLHLADTGVSICTRNCIMTGLRFLFRVTLRRLDLAEEIYHIREPQKLPLVMSVDEMKRLLAVAGNLKTRVLLSLGYGCGLRASEIVRLKVKHIETEQKIIRIEQSKGRKDRYVKLPEEMRGLLRQWWKARPSRHDPGTPLQERWLFPSRKSADRPITTRHLNRLFHEAADAAGIKKGVTLHTLRRSFAPASTASISRSRAFNARAVGLKSIGARVPHAPTSLTVKPEFAIQPTIASPSTTAQRVARMTGPPGEQRSLGPSVLFTLKGIQRFPRNNR